VDISSNLPFPVEGTEFLVESGFVELVVLCI